jgi:hypothetical protein
MVKGREEWWEKEEVFPFFEGKKREWWIMSEEKQKNEKGIGLYIVENWWVSEWNIRVCFVSVWNWKMTQWYG